LRVVATIRNTKRGFYDLLNDIEQQLKNKHDINVMVVPVKPEKENSASVGA